MGKIFGNFHKMRRVFLQRLIIVVFSPKQFSASMNPRFMFCIWEYRRIEADEMMHMTCLLQSFPSTFSLEQKHSYITYEQQPYRVCITFRSSLSIDLLMSFVDLTQIQALDWSMIKNLSIGDIYSLVQATPQLNSLIFEHVASLFIPPAHIYSCTINKWRLSDEFN